MTASTEIRILVKDDWANWKKIRLEAVKLHPEAFGGSYEDEARNSDDVFQQGLTKNTIFGAFTHGVLVGVAGFFILSPRKKQHRGALFSVYLKKEYRGQGIADQLVETVVAHAKSKVLQLHCAVVTTNLAAVKLYQKYGFEIYGTEPRSLRIDNTYYDEYLMVLTF